MAAPVAFRQCFTALQSIQAGLRHKDTAPALQWAREHRVALRAHQIDVEFQLVRLQYLDVLENCTNVIDAVDFASKELSGFHDTHAKRSTNL